MDFYWLKYPLQQTFISSHTYDFLSYTGIIKIKLHANSYECSSDKYWIASLIVGAVAISNKTSCNLSGSAIGSICVRANTSKEGKRLCTSASMLLRAPNIFPFFTNR